MAYTLIPSSSAPTFNQTKKPGWHSRLLYSYAWNYDKDTYDATSTTVFDAIPKENSKGSYIFPQNYWTGNVGRHIRIKGMFRYTSPGSSNMLILRVGLTDGTNLAWVRAENGANHIFANGDKRESVPVSVELNISYQAKIDTPADRFKVTGHYQYEYEDYAIGGNNAGIKNVLVPLYQQDPVVGLDFTQYIEIKFWIYDQATVSPMWFTVEELS